MKTHALFLCLFCFCFTSCSRPIDSIRARALLKSTCNEYLGRHDEQDNWWLPIVPDASTEAVMSLERATQIVQDSVKRSKGASPLADEIASEFTSFFPTLLTGEKVIALQHHGENTPQSTQSREICFIAHSEYVRTYGPPLYYQYNWRTVMITGIEWPQPFFAALTMHELGHALRHKKGVSPRMFSYEWLKEEVDMHKLEAQVIDHFTAGRYTQILKTICDRYPKARSAIELMAMVSAGDFEELDTVLGITKSGRTLRGTSCAQHIASLGFLFIEQKKGTITDKVTYYQWVIEK